jgi:hypothetical protein
MLAAEVTTLSVTDREGLGTLPVFRAALAADAPIIELVAMGLGGVELGGVELGGAVESPATAGQ